MAWMKKRGETKDGRGRYLVQWRDPEGRHRGQTVTGREAALGFKREVEAALAGGSYVDPRAGKVRLRAYAGEWMSTAVHLRPATRQAYDSLLRSHIYRLLGDVPINRVRPRDLRRFVADLTGRGLSAKTVRNAYTLLVEILRSARDDGLIAAVPVPVGERGRRTILPRLQKAEQRFLSAEEVDLLASMIDHCYRALVFLGAYGGLRWGELAGLKVPRLRLLERRVEVVETTTGEPKWGSAGTVGIPAAVAEELAAHLAEYPPGPDGFVFTSPDGGALAYHRFLRRVWRPAVQVARLEPLRMHDLRHTAVALAVEAGAHPKEIQELLRHRSITTTLNTYGHLFPALHERLAERLDATIRRARAHKLNTPEPAEVVPIRAASGEGAP